MSGHIILLADSTPDNARQLVSRISALGYTVAGPAVSGPDALGLAVENVPDVVLINANLEGPMDAVDTGAEFGRRWQVPVVFLTASADESTLRRLGVTGPFGYVVEPYTDRELQMNIATAVHDAQTTRQFYESEDSFFAVAVDMLCFLDFSGYFKRLNPAWEKTLGFTREELMSKPFIEFVHPDDRDRTLKQNKSVREGGNARYFENRYLCKDGSYRWFLWNATPVVHHRVIYSVARDVTEQKRAAEERENLVRELQAALAEVKTLQAILPICSYCRKIRDDANYWQTVEGYISEHTATKFSHGICPECFKSEVEPQLGD